MIGLHAAGITDVGQQRAANEDSLHVGDSVFAVADGMGGHAAGEVASALALEPIAGLDGRVFGDVDEARGALGDAVVEANRVVIDAASHDHALSGMGTTLTAALFATMIRLVGGPNTLDRLISLDALVAVAQGGIGVYIAWSKDTTPAAALVALALVAFLGSVSVARFRVNDTVGTPEEALP